MWSVTAKGFTVTVTVQQKVSQISRNAKQNLKHTILHLNIPQITLTKTPIKQSQDKLSTMCLWRAMVVSEFRKNFCGCSSSIK